MSAPVFVRLGMCTPLGLTAPATQHAIAARLAAFRDSTVMCRDGEPIRAAWLPALDPAATRAQRMLFFAERALRECLIGIPKAAFSSIPVFVALPEPGRGAPLIPRDILLGLAGTSPPDVALDWSASPFATGRAGFFQALDAAVSAIAKRTAEIAVVAGFDSYCDPASLEQLDDVGRNLCDENSDGLIPGEGAGAVLLADPLAARRAGLPAFASLEACALGRDPEPFEKRRGAIARGLTDVLRRLSRALPAQTRADAVFSCQPGEGLWARELSIAHLRNPAVMPEPQRRFLLAENLGDAGAAAGPIQLGMLLHFHARTRPAARKLDRAILYGAADSGDTGACFVSVSSPRTAPRSPAT